MIDDYKQHSVVDAPVPSQDSVRPLVGSSGSSKSTAQSRVDLANMIWEGQLRSALFLPTALHCQLLLEGCVSEAHGSQTIRGEPRVLRA